MWVFVGLGWHAAEMAALHKAASGTLAWCRRNPNRLPITSVFKWCRVSARAVVEA